MYIRISCDYSIWSPHTLTNADDTSILKVRAIMFSHTSVLTLQDAGLRAIAVQVVKEDIVSPWPKESLCQWNPTCMMIT